MHRGFESNGAPFMLAPRVTVASPQTGPSLIVSSDLTVAKGQRLTLLLSESPLPASGPPLAYAFSMVAPADGTTHTFQTTGVKNRTYLVRLQCRRCAEPSRSEREKATTRLAKSRGGAVIAAAWTDANQRHLANGSPSCAPCSKRRPDANRRQFSRTGSGDRPYHSTSCSTCSASRRSSGQLLFLLRRHRARLQRWRRCAASLQGDANLHLSTFSLALGVLPDPHWSAITPARRCAAGADRPHGHTSAHDRAAAHRRARAALPRRIDQVDERLAAVGGRSCRGTRSRRPAKRWRRSRGLWSAASGTPARPWARSRSAPRRRRTPGGGRAACAQLGLDAVRHFRAGRSHRRLDRRAGTPLSAKPAHRERHRARLRLCRQRRRDALEAVPAVRLAAERPAARGRTRAALNRSNALATSHVARPHLDEQRDLGGRFGGIAARMNGDLDRVAWQFALCTRAHSRHRRIPRRRRHAGHPLGFVPYGGPQAARRSGAAHRQPRLLERPRPAWGPARHPARGHRLRPLPGPRLRRLGLRRERLARPGRDRSSPVSGTGKHCSRGAVQQRVSPVSRRPERVISNYIGETEKPLRACSRRRMGLDPPLYEADRSRQAQRIEGQPPLRQLEVSSCCSGGLPRRVHPDHQRPRRPSTPAFLRRSACRAVPLS